MQLMIKEMQSMYKHTHAQLKQLKGVINHARTTDIKPGVATDLLIIIISI
jgi:hypothetical protein